MNIIDANIGSAKDNMKSPVNNWYKFTAGFSYKLVDLIVDGMENKPNCIYEPFAGCGTTLVAAQKKRIHAVGNESQKIMCNVINAKLNWDIDRNVCASYLKLIFESLHERQEHDNIETEYNKTLVSLYDNKTLRDLYLLRDEIFKIKQEKYRLFFELALSQTLHKSSLYPIAVPYISRSKKQMHPGDACGKFATIVDKMLDDLSTMPHTKKTAEVYNVDSRKVNTSILTDSCDLCITSPPYLNNLDYGEVSKVPSHFFCITNNWHDITEKVRHQLVTAATTHYNDSDFNLEEFSKCEFALCNKDIFIELEKLFSKIKENANARSGKKSFHIMMMHYFDDMYYVLKEMRRVLKEGSHAYLILGDSAPYGVYVQTTQILGQIAISVGFNEFSISKIRTRGTKWKGLKYRHDIELSENILELI